jgi:hypothetical protein
MMRRKKDRDVESYHICRRSSNPKVGGSNPTGRACLTTTYDESPTHQDSLAHTLPTFSTADPDLALIVSVWDRLADECKRVLIEMVYANLPTDTTTGPTLTLVANSAGASETRASLRWRFYPTQTPAQRPLTGIRHQCHCWVYPNQGSRASTGRQLGSGLVEAAGQLPGADPLRPALSRNPPPLVSLDGGQLGGAWLVEGRCQGPGPMGRSIPECGAYTGNMDTTSAMPMLGLSSAQTPPILSPDQSPIFRGEAVPKKPATKRPTGSSRHPVPTQPNAITNRGSAQWKEWLESFAAKMRSKPTAVIDLALAKLAEQERFSEPPPRIPS